MTKVLSNSTVSASGQCFGQWACTYI